jgi:hypothetical protein
MTRSLLERAAKAAKPVALKVGDRIKDNDPRMTARPALRIVAVHETHVVAVDGRFAFKVQIRRIHSDGKPRRSGFDLVRAAASMVKE